MLTIDVPWRETAATSRIQVIQELDRSSSRGFAVLQKATFHYWNRTVLPSSVPELDIVSLIVRLAPAVPPRTSAVGASEWFLIHGRSRSLALLAHLPLPALVRGSRRLRHLVITKGASCLSNDFAHENRFFAVPAASAAGATEDLSKKGALSEVLDRSQSLFDPRRSGARPVANPMIGNEDRDRVLRERRPNRIEVLAYLRIEVGYRPR